MSNSEEEIRRTFADKRRRKIFLRAVLSHEIDTMVEE